MAQSSRGEPTRTDLRMAATHEAAGARRSEWTAEEEVDGVAAGPPG